MSPRATGTASQAARERMDAAPGPPAHPPPTAPPPGGRGAGWVRRPGGAWRGGPEGGGPVGGERGDGAWRPPPGGPRPPFPPGRLPGLGPPVAVTAAAPRWAAQPRRSLRRKLVENPL